MSSHRNLDGKTLDLSLRYSLKNWVARKAPPADAKIRLLSAAAAEASGESSPKASFMSGMIYIALNDQLNELYLERFKISPLYLFQPGSLELTSSKGMV